MGKDAGSELSSSLPLPVVRVSVTVISRRGLRERNRNRLVREAGFDKDEEPAIIETPLVERRAVR